MELLTELHLFHRFSENDAVTQNVLSTAIELRAGWFVFPYPGSG